MSITYRLLAHAGRGSFFPTIHASTGAGAVAGADGKKDSSGTARSTRFSSSPRYAGTKGSTCHFSIDDVSIAGIAWPYQHRLGLTR